MASERGATVLRTSQQKRESFAPTKERAKLATAACRRLATKDGLPSPRAAAEAVGAAPSELGLLRRLVWQPT